MSGIMSALEVDDTTWTRPHPGVNTILDVAAEFWLMKALEKQVR